MKKKVLAKRKMQAEKRLGKSLKVPMVTKKTKGGGKKGQWAAFTADDIAAAAFGDWAKDVAEAATPTDDAEKAAIDTVLEGLDKKKTKRGGKKGQWDDAAAAAAFTADDIAAAAFGDWAENIAEAATPIDDAE